jgi:hypothetical protein
MPEKATRITTSPGLRSASVSFSKRAWMRPFSE